ncbi:MAG: alanine racemase [Oscillospiraceae bacterium]|nr:alanine racemase [Oscillospiraceae bacterium]
MERKNLKRAWAQIHLDRLKRNIEKCKALLKEPTELMCVVKANCYGHGIEKIIPFLQDEAGIDWFAVSNLVEAIELRGLGVTGEILILGYTPPENAPELAEYDIIQAVTEPDYAKKLARHCPVNESVRVHIAFDTGMTRIGIAAADVYKACNMAEEIFKLERIEAEGIFTHLSVADSEADTDLAYTSCQIEKLMQVKSELNKRLVLTKYVHFLNSAGLAYHNDERSDLARVGIMLYGLKPNAERALPVDLEPVMELKACVSQVKQVQKGTDISYGRTYTAARDMKIAVVTIGYADGYSRLLSGRASVLIKGELAPVVGRVCMDQLMIDVTEIDGVCEGDVVTLIGRDGGREITADELASLCGTIGYEIVCGISPRVPRIFED